MARLNEPPVASQPSAEAIDVIKRRFLRQNRELAKTNSQQSIRIRSLENDCSRLLAENLALREQVLNLHHNIESRPALEQIDAVKSQLEAKLMEIGSLVAGLSKVKSESGKDTSRRKSQTTAKRRSGERQWRSGLGLQEVENGMLPTIAEDKYYPRRTLGAEELQHLLADPDSQSPDIGPPPVSRFENEDPIAFNTDTCSEEQVLETAENGEATLSSNLEMRKKRRESGPKLNIRRLSVFESPEESEDAVTKPVRATKRKFSVQEDEEMLHSKGEPFRFSRRTTPGALEGEAVNEKLRPSSPERPILGAKPVNTDPVVTISPKKQRSSVEEKNEKPAKLATKSRGRQRLNITRNGIQPDLSIQPIPEPVPTTDIILDSLPPKTPAVEAIFSPPSTEPSSQRPDSKDTPPPGDINSSDQPGQGTRPGRRARPQVSYKEPSLSVKMRRPDAKLVDAVIDRRTSVESQTAPPTTIKREFTSDLGWKPASSVSGRGCEEEGEVGSPLRQKLERQAQDLKTSPVSESSEERSAASKAISALINETSTAKRRASMPASDTIVSNPTSEPVVAKLAELTVPTKALTGQREPQEVDKLAVFDFTESSPVNAVPNPRTRITELAKAARNARRHSAMPTTSAVDDDQKTEKAAGALQNPHKRTGSGTVKSTSTTSSSGKTMANPSKGTSATARSTMKEKKSTSTVLLPLSGSNTDLRPKVEAAAEKEAEPRVARETTALRAERAASRRKSMMV